MSSKICINPSIIIIIIIKIESAVQGRERVRTVNKYEDTNPWKEEEEKIVGAKRKSKLGQQESIGSYLKTSQSHTHNTGSRRSFQRDTERRTKVL